MGRHLDRLDDGRVFDIVKKRDGKFVIGERCDDYYAELFTADELLELAQEIIEVAGK